MEKQIIKKLDAYALALDAREERQQDMRAIIDETIPDDIKQKIKEIEESFAVDINQANIEVERLEKEVKDMVLVYGKSVAGRWKQAVYRRGSISWNKDYLLGLAKSTPEILNARKIGEPSVAIRAVNGK